MDGHDITILIGAVTLVFCSLVLAVHYIDDKYNKKDAKQKH